MNDYSEVRIDLTPCSEDATDCLAYLLAEAGYESFVPDEKGLSAYIPVGQFDQAKLNAAMAEFPYTGMSMKVKTQVIEGRDWNEEWERNFYQPILVDDRVVVHSTFHTDVPQAQYSISIDPKMAFGTGHHATTTLMIRRLLDEDVAGKYVIDMGTGTGILAILAAMLGAERITAVEIDAFACVNARENLQLNSVAESVTLVEGDASALQGLEGAALFMANINRNVITADLPTYVRTLQSGGTMLLSGFYENDVPIVRQAAEDCGLQYIDHIVKDNWACIKLIKK